MLITTAAFLNIYQVEYGVTKTTICYYVAIGAMMALFFFIIMLSSFLRCRLDRLGERSIEDRVGTIYDYLIREKIT